MMHRLHTLEAASVLQLFIVLNVNETNERFSKQTSWELCTYLILVPDPCRYIDATGFNNWEPHHSHTALVSTFTPPCAFTPTRALQALDTTLNVYVLSKIV
eukprot:gene17606-biopygen5058